MDQQKSPQQGGRRGWITVVIILIAVVVSTWIGIGIGRGVESANTRRLLGSMSEDVARYNQFAKDMEALCRAGLLNIVGGCCGTTPAYTESMAKVAQRWRPRKTGKKN